MRNIIDSNGGITSAPTAQKQILPVPNATVPYWRSQLHPIDSHRSTRDLPSECDIAVIGAGMSGVAMAYHLTKGLSKDDMPSIVLVEARNVCEGATGRNGGHVKSKVSGILSMIERFGYEAAMEVKELENDQVYQLKRVVEEEGLECEFEMRRSFDVFLDAEEAEEVKEAYFESVRRGERWTRDVGFVGPEIVEQVTSMNGAKAAFNVPACSLWPYKFVTQLLARLLEREAVNLQTNTPVTRISRESGVNILHTPRGSLKAKKVIFATNAYTGGIAADYHGCIVPYKGTAVHIRPSKPRAPHLSNTYNIFYQPHRVDYMNPRPNSGIVIGGGKWTYEEPRDKWFNVWDDSTTIHEVRTHFDGLMRRHFNGWDDAEEQLDAVWTGIMGMTADGLPHVGEVEGSEGNQFILAGFNGGGMSMIFSTAEGLAKMVVEGMRFEETGLPRLFKTTKQRLEKSVEL